MQYLTEDLLTSIKLRSLVPISQSTFQDADLIQLANEEMQLKLVADIMSERENFFLNNETRSITQSVDAYPLPSRAIGNALKILWYVDTQGNKQKLQLKDVDQLPNYIGSGSQPEGFYLQGDQVVLMPTPSNSIGSLRFDFFWRPNKLVATSTCTKATAISSSLGTTTFTVDTDLSASLSVGSLVDVVSMRSPFVVWSYQVPITAISGTTVSVLTANIADQSGAVKPIVGDYICPTGTANIPQVPQEFHAVLAQMVAVRLLWGLGDQVKLDRGMQILKEDRENALKLIKNRVEATPMRVNTRDGIVSAFNRRY